jgi:hypothetical protein
MAHFCQRICLTERGVNMDFSIRSFAQAFESAKYESKHTSFPLYAFILATPSDNNVFPGLLAHYKELHNLTGNEILIISPRLEMYKSRNEPFNEIEIAEVLGTKKFFNHYSQEYVDVSNMVDKFLEDQTTQTYRFAKFINLDIKDIPCLIFFDTLESPDKYIYWSIKGTSPSDVIKDFREITTLSLRIHQENKKVDILKSINALDRKRLAIRIMHKFLEVAPNLISLSIT